ncbi:MAG: hypothetical protein AB1413_06275 [Thermodesulfobacteriota bacterium]
MTINTSDTQMDFGTVAQWAGASATFLAVLVALFKDEFLRWRRKPELRVSIALGSPDCQKTMLNYVVQKTALTYGVAECYYLRIWVENVGKTRAERVQVFAAKLSKCHADGSFKKVDDFLPMNLLWAHGQQGKGGPEIFAEGISPQMGKHCDLGHIVDPKHRKDVGYDLPTVAPDDTVLALDLEVKPNTLSHLIPPGVYRLELRVAAANCLPVSHTLEITNTGKWFSEQTRMFADGLGIRTIN